MENEELQNEELQETESRKVLICPKCGSEIEIVENQTIGHCTLCDSLVPLPFFVVQEDKVTALQYKNMLNRINKAIEFSLSHQFHRAFNLYDKLIKNNYNLNVKDVFPYFGKFLNQYGATYLLNDSLEPELVCLNVVKESIYENENYQKAISASDANIQAILKKEASAIDNFQKEVRKELIKSTPVDVAVLVNLKDANNPHVLELQELLNNKNIIVRLAIVDFEQITKEKVIAINQIISMAKHLVIFGESFDDINDTMYRNTWMSYYQDSEIQEDINNHMTIFGKIQEGLDTLPIKDLPIFDSTKATELTSYLVEHLSFKEYTNNPEYQELWDLIKLENFEEVRNLLNHKLRKTALDYEGWLLLFLAKHKIKSLDEIDNLVINPLNSYYFQRTYMYAGRMQKEALYDYYEKCMQNLSKLSEIDEEYEKEVLTEQAKIYKKTTVKIYLQIIPVIIVSLFSLWTLSLTSSFQIIIMFALYFITYAVFLITFIKNMTMGRVPKIIRENKSEDNYLFQLRKLLDAKSASKYIPGQKTKRMHIASIIALAICLLFTGIYFTKEISVKIKNPSINYYYAFNSVYIVGGQGDDVYIPSKISGKEVLGITSHAFEANHSIRTLTIDEGLKYIESGAFHGCANLIKVELPASITRVVDEPFKGCNELQTFIYLGNHFRPADFLGNDYQSKMLNLVYLN